ncbi:hypothetical protein K8I31_23100, partial [bacterium]|nr:hypothetical protein [bacterium]
MKLICFSSLFILLFTVSSTAHELLVPDDFPTIADAVLASASGDVILLVSSEVEWGGPITIENKNLVIEGAEEYGRVNAAIDLRIEYAGNNNIKNTKTLLLQNSNLLIKNMQVDNPIFYHLPEFVFSVNPSPIFVDPKSDLELYNCSFRCPFV